MSLELDFDHIMAGLLTNKSLSYKEMAIICDGANRIRPVLAEQDELDEQEAEANALMEQAKAELKKERIAEALNKHTNFYKGK